MILRSKYSKMMFLDYKYFSNAKETYLHLVHININYFLRTTIPWRINVKITSQRSLHLNWLNSKSASHPPFPWWCRLVENSRRLFLRWQHAYSICRCSIHDRYSCKWTNWSSL